MSNKTINIHKRITLRATGASVVIVFLGALYIWSLVKLDPKQLHILILTLVVLAPFLLIISGIEMKFLLLPIIRVLDKVKAGQQVDEQERNKAERRAFTFMYLSALNGLILYTVGGAALSWIMVKKAGLGIDDGIFIWVCAVSCGALSGLTLLYYYRRPIREALQFILENLGGAEKKPPFFAPLVLKLSGSFAILILLIVVFLGLLSFVTMKGIHYQDRLESQKKDVLMIANVVASVGDEQARLVSLLDKASGPDRIFCLADKDLKVQYCPIKGTEFQVSEALSRIGELQLAEDKKRGWIWMWAGTVGGGRLLTGWKTGEIQITGSSLGGKYIKVTVVVVLLGVVLGILVALDIARPLKDLSENAVRISKGDLDVGVTAGGDDETGILARAFNRMTKVILNQLQGELNRGKQMMESINNAVNSLAPMSRELVAIAEQQASGSMEQASAAEEAATTSGEIVAVSKQIAENASDVSKNAEAMLELTEKGQQRINLTKEEFDNINEKMKNIAKAVLTLGEESQEIGGVVRIIDEISEQTNLLALNASIEAVGAGEHGRRFGVVAQEIRRMSQSTAQSTKKIKEIINRMQNAVSSSIMHAEEGDKAVLSGRKAIDETTIMFDQILQANKAGAPRLREINLMTSQQATASEQMANTIAEVRESANQSSAAASELQASIRELENIVKELQLHLEKEK